jgi:formylglycine-generating enzyme required for sulfatase activity
MKVLWTLALVIFAGCKAYDFNYEDDEEQEGVIACDKLSSFEPICVNKATNIELILIAGGTFAMGASDDQAKDDETPARSVTITKPFYIAVYETTKTQWRAVMGGDRGGEPIGNVGWESVAGTRGFIAKLNADAGEIVIGGELYEYALPSEAEWEYAARGGQSAPYSWGDETLAGEYAWFNANSNAKAHTTGAKKPNGFGLYDTSGNVAEWVQDCYDLYSPAPQIDPINECNAGDRVVRGGSYASDLNDLRVSKRDRKSELHSDVTIGFRLALVPKR